LPALRRGLSRHRAAVEDSKVGKLGRIGLHQALRSQERGELLRFVLVDFAAQSLDRKGFHSGHSDADRSQNPLGLGNFEAAGGVEFFNAKIFPRRSLYRTTRLCRRTYNLEPRCDKGYILCLCSQELSTLEVSIEPAKGTRQTR
jgi:hypothetical protein